MNRLLPSFRLKLTDWRATADGTGIKKATRESFGMALCELAKTNKDIMFLMQTSQLLQRQDF